MVIHARAGFSVLSKRTACGIEIPDSGVTQAPLPGFAIHATILPRMVDCLACIRVTGPRLGSVPPAEDPG